jgi:hypothetical protein
MTADSALAHGAPTAAVGRPARSPRKLGIGAPLVELCRARLARSRIARLGLVSAWGTTLVFAVMAIALRAGDGVDASFGGLVVQATRIVAWVAGGSVALAAAADRASLDRRDGIETLAAVRGASPLALAAARALATMIQVARAILGPALSLAALAVILSGTVFVALSQLGVAAAVAVFAVVTGVVVGAAADVCARLGRRQGRWLLLAVIVAPWIAADIAGRSAWSIPGALSALLELAVRLLSGGVG